jgi:hypothetical protein
LSIFDESWKKKEERKKKIENYFISSCLRELKVSEHVPESAKSMIKVSQSTRRGFYKKALSGFEKLFLFWVCMNPWNP